MQVTSISTAEIFEALPTDSVRESLRIQLAQFLQPQDPDRILQDSDPALIVAILAIVERALYLHMRIDAFSSTQPGDWRIEVGEGIQPVISFQALTPRGAVFLAELATMGFFGAEAQEELAA